jgi:glycosyltransferase involved in cell wall biosynthesis
VNENVKKFFEERFPSSKNKVIVIHNGVSEMNFCVKSPDDLQGIKRPMIGYVGVISERIDFGLVEFLAQNRKDYSFVFVGPFYGNVGDWVRRLKRLKNVFFLGERHYDEIPNYIASFDVCIIPHIVDEFTLSNDPMKVYEYIYAGKPVVSTGIYINAELLDFVFVARERGEFMKCLDEAVRVSRDDSFILRQRAGIKKWMFWNERAKIMLDEIFDNLSCKY